MTGPAGRAQHGQCIGPGEAGQCPSTEPDHLERQYTMKGKITAQEDATLAIALRYGLTRNKDVNVQRTPGPTKPDQAVMCTDHSKRLNEMLLFRWTAQWQRKSVRQAGVMIYKAP